MAQLRIKVRPRSAREGIRRDDDGLVTVSVTTVAEGGKANAAVVKLLADWASVPKSSVVIQRGTVARVKTVEFTTIQPEDLDSLVGSLNNNS